MPSDSITREELKAAMEAQIKNTEQMIAVVRNLEKIIETQNHITALQEKIVDKLTNGLKEEIAHEVITELTISSEPTINTIKESCRLLNERTPLICQISKDMDRTKWFVGLIGTFVIISTIILKVIDTRTLQKDKTVLNKIEAHLQEASNAK